MICNMDCFNCIFPDCINNGRETKSEKQMKNDLKQKTFKETYYERNREILLKKAKEYNATHREERKKYYKEYYRRNAEEKKEYRRIHHIEMSANPEYVEKNRKRCAEYRRRKKNAIIENPT